MLENIQLQSFIWITIDLVEYLYRLVFTLFDIITHAHIQPRTLAQNNRFPRQLLILAPLNQQYFDHNSFV